MCSFTWNNMLHLHASVVSNLLSQFKLFTLSTKQCGKSICGHAVILFGLRHYEDSIWGMLAGLMCLYGIYWSSNNKKINLIIHSCVISLSSIFCNDHQLQVSSLFILLSRVLDAYDEFNRLLVMTHHSMIHLQSSQS